MNPGDSVQEASRSGLDEASGLGAAGQDPADQGSADQGRADQGRADTGRAGYSNGTPARSPRTQKPLQDIQDLIDKLAAVTQQLRHPGSRVAGPSNLDPQATQQPRAVGRAQRGGAQERERADVPGDVVLAFQVDAAR